MKVIELSEVIRIIADEQQEFVKCGSRLSGLFGKSDNGDFGRLLASHMNEYMDSLIIKFREAAHESN